MAVVFDSAQISLRGVQTISVSTVQPDTNSDEYIRLIQIYTDPPSVTDRRPVLTLALYGGSQTTHEFSELSITVPASEF